MPDADTGAHLVSLPSALQSCAECRHRAAVRLGTEQRRLAVACGGTASEPHTAGGRA